MKRVKFVYDAGYVGTEISEIMEFEDNITEEELEEELEVWVENNSTHSSWLVEVDEDDNEFYISNISEIKDFFDEYDYSRYSICNYRDREEIAQDTMFLTIRECREHIERNKHHYNKPHSYAMTAWRSPQVERLYKILENTNFNELLEKIK